MRKNLVLILLHSIIVLSIIFISCLLIKSNVIFEWIIYSSTSIGLVLCVIFWKDLIEAAKKVSFDRYISLISLEIALIVFIQASIQFEKNSIASDSLFQAQLKHAEKLNQLLIKNAQNLNVSLTNELNKIQSINITQSLAANDQLLATHRQLELSEQSLKDYIFETRAELTWGETQIVKIDTLDSAEVRLTLENIVLNKGNRQATEVEFREFIILKNKIYGDVYVNNPLEFIFPNSPQAIRFYFTIPRDEYKDFFRWIQIRYFDERLERYFDRSICYHYYDHELGFNFYYATKKEKSYLRTIVDEELKKKGFSLTVN